MTGDRTRASRGNADLRKVLAGLGNGSPMTTGNVYIVIPSSDAGNEQLVKDYQKTYLDGSEMIQPTMAAANSAIVTNRNDVVLVSANAAHAQTEMLTISKNRSHWISMSNRPGIGMGARSRITMGATGVATDLAVMKNTGVSNTFTGFKFDSSSTTAESLYGIIEAGEYAIYNACEFYKSEDLDDAGAAEIALNGDSAQFIDCVIGSSANETGNIRANVLVTGGIVSGKKARDCYFENCMFLAKADDTDKVFVYGANATDVERSLTFKGCTFFNNPLGAGTPAAAIAFGAAQTEGAVFCDANTACVDVTVLGTTGQNIFVISQDGSTYATAGLAVSS